MSKGRPTPKAPQNQGRPKMTPEEEARIAKIEANCGFILGILDGELMNDAISTLETCKGILQARLQRIYAEMRVTKDEPDESKTNTTEDEV